MSFLDKINEILAHQLKENPITICRLVQLSWDKQWSNWWKTLLLINPNLERNCVWYGNDYEARKRHNTEDDWFDEEPWDVCDDPEDYDDTGELRYDPLGYNSQLEFTWCTYPVKLPNPVMASKLVVASKTHE